MVDPRDDPIELVPSRYERLKRRLVADTDGLTDYSVGKTEFVGRLLDAAAADGALEFEFDVPSVDGPPDE